MLLIKFTMYQKINWKLQNYTILCTSSTNYNNPMEVGQYENKCAFRPFNQLQFC